MIKRIALLAAVALPAFAGSETTKIWKNEFSIGGEIQHYHYKEPDVSQDFERLRFTSWMDLKGILFGIHGSYKLTYKDLLFVQPEGRVLMGR